MKRRPSDGYESLAPPAGLQVAQLGDDLVLLSFPVAGPGAPAVLTAAEWEVARLVYEGGSNAEVARARNVSVKTIGNQLVSIYRKLGAASRAELVLHLHARHDDRSR